MNRTPNLEKIRRDLELAGEAREYLRESSRPGLAGLCEPSPLLEKLRVEGLALAALEIWRWWKWRGQDWTCTARLPNLPLRAPLATRAPGGPNGSRFRSRRTRLGEGGRTQFDPTPPSSVPPVALATLPRLSELARALPDFRSLVTELGGKINPDGTVDSSASAELGRVRRAIERAKLEIQSSLERMLRRFSQDACSRTPW